MQTTTSNQFTGSNKLPLQPKHRFQPKHWFKPKRSIKPHYYLTRPDQTMLQRNEHPQSRQLRYGCLFALTRPGILHLIATGEHFFLKKFGRYQTSAFIKVSQDFCLLSKVNSITQNHLPSRLRHIQIWENSHIFVEEYLQQAILRFITQEYNMIARDLIP